MSEQHPNVGRVTEAAKALDLDIEVVEYPDGTRTAPDAAAAVGCDVAQIVKSLVFLLDGAPCLALVAGDRRLDPDRLTDALGGSDVARADADAVRSATGFPIGGVPPFAHATEMAVALDRSLLAHEAVWAAAGTPRHVFRVAPAALFDAVGGTVADLGQPA
ncbi:MAG: YbaK/EbsC family protein [Actinomycetota bacterium]